MKIYSKKQKLNILAPITIFLLCFILIIAVTNGFTSRINGKPYFNKGANIIGISAKNSVSANIDNWQLILINSNYYLPDDYEIKLKTLENNIKIDERIYDDLQDMFNAALNDEVYPVIGSAYRTNDEQQQLYTDKINAYISQGYSKKKSKKLANNWVALPKTSEHQLGLALDINADKEKCDNQTVYNWLNKNSYKYGFILRYPTDKAHITGVNHEPWHYRYVGKKYAKEIYEQGVCLEEYINLNV